MDEAIWAKISRRGLLVGAGAAMVTPPRRAVAVTPQMEITPTTALQDVPLRIRVNGLAPSSRVKVAAEMTARDGIVWRSHAVFRTDGGGSVDVGSSGPVEGGGTTEGRAHANEDWWPKALAFLTAAAAG